MNCIIKLLLYRNLFVILIYNETVIRHQTFQGVKNTVTRSPASIIKFYVIKLILLCLVNLCATLAAFLISKIVAPFESLLYRWIVNGIPFFFFMYFMFTVESRIKLPEEKEKLTGKYFFFFSLRELSVYLIFLLPLLALYLSDEGFIYGSGLLTLFYCPHALLFHVGRGLPHIAKILIPAAVFGVIAFAAHYVKSKKPAPAPIPAEKSADEADEAEEASADEEENED